MKNSKIQSVLIIVAHTDDETFGMGGTIKKHHDKGDKIYAISMTNGVGSRLDINKNKEIRKREKASYLASKILGFKWLDNYDFSDNSMDSYPLLEVVRSIENSKRKIKPDIIYTHSNADLNIDHRIVLNAVLTAFRPCPDENYCEIRLFEVPSSTDYGNSQVIGDFVPNLFIDITDEWKTKKAAINCYKHELRKYPHSRSKEGIETLSKIRGTQSGLKKAEAFQIIRRIES